jgi:hypothetical protein
MDPHVTREILWNIPAGFVVFLYAMLLPLTAAFVYAGLRWYRIERLGTPDARPRFDQPSRRFFMAFRDGVGQGFAGRESWGWVHYALYVRFPGLFIGTTIIFFNDKIAEVAGFFVFPYSLVGTMEIR